MPLLRRMWPMLTGICVGTWAMRAWAGAGLLTAADGVYASIGLGAVLVVVGVDERADELELIWGGIRHEM